MGKRRILLVDDEFLILYALAKTLASDSIEVTQVQSAEEALSKIDGTHYDLCLLDHCLPGMSGLQAMRLIHENSPETKVVIMTATHLNPREQAMVEEVAYCLIKKPFDLLEVKELANQILRLTPGRQGLNRIPTR